MISREKIIALYSAMVKYRALAAHAESLVQQGQLAGTLLVPGREAAMAAITSDLRPHDSFVATQSPLAFTLISNSKKKRASKLAAMNGHLRNAKASTADTAIAQAIEAAKAFNSTKGDAIAVLFSETRLKAEVWRKRLQQASRNNLPIVFVRLTAPSRRAHTAPAAFSFGVPLIAVDADDVRAVYRVAGESIARARHRRGPTLIDCVQFSHPDSDPIHALALVLAKKRILNAILKQEIAGAVEREIKSTLRALAN